MNCLSKLILSWQNFLFIIVNHLVFEPVWSNIIDNADVRSAILPRRYVGCFSITEALL